MISSMIRFKLKILPLVALLLLSQFLKAQDNAYHSVLRQGTWFKLSVAKENVYKLDYSTIQAMGIDMSTLNPDRIRIFGNPSGVLPEKNQAVRPDDLSELAIYVSGAEDGIFDQSDYVLFYGQEPTLWILNGDKYQRERNYYTDTTYYYLCLDGDVQGLRVEAIPSLSVEDATNIVTEFPDFQCHEEELVSPYNIGRNWFGEMLSAQDSELHLDFVFPNLVTDKALSFKSMVMGRDKSGAMHYNLRINNNLLVNNASIDKPGNNYYGVLADANGQFFIEGDTACVVLSTNPQETKATLHLDYLELYAWRHLIRVGQGFPFRIKPSQLTHGKSAVWIQNVESRHWLWDVSNPLVPSLQEGRLSANNFVFAFEGKTDKRYFMFDPSEALSVASWSAVPNQDLHSIADADMLVITDRILWEQAQALADFHAENDGLLSVVVDAKEIYNEFSTGIPDPTGIRDFIRMVYHRSAGQLKYVTLFGRASYDSRDLERYGLNLVPCYEDLEKPNWEISFCTDDYYALMDDNEGEGCSGHVDLGVGRIPVATPSDAEAVLRKIRYYADLSSNYGEWKTNHLFVSDNDKSEYIQNNEDYESIMDTIEPALNVDKIYCGAYPQVNTSAGYRYPQVTADLLKAIEKGLLSFTYTGHGGVIALAEERIFGLGEIASLTNFEHLPFVFTATCEFSKYDNPALISAGEQLFSQPNGGAIAMLTTCRPTFGIHNVRLGKSLSNQLYRRDEEGRPMRIGDIVRIAKADNLNFSNNSSVSLNIRHVLFGDPALRIAIPEGKVKTLKVNGLNTETEGISIHAMSMVTVEGEITDYQGQPDAMFNGELWVRLFDRKAVMQVEYDKGETGIKTVKCHKDELYRGKATVRNGRFSLSFQMPKDINLDDGAPRFSYYAYDSIRNVDAMGYYDDLTLGGIDPAMAPDNEGPSVSFYWNAPSFANGDVVESDGTLYADLYDAQGIYHYDFSIGRNIMLGSNAAEYDNMVLNDWFEPATDDYRRGQIALPVKGLVPGTYDFKLKVWDTQDNCSESSLWLVVGEDADIFLAQVRNFPNPFSEETWFTLTHGGEDGDFDLTIEVFDLMGRCVHRMVKRVSSTDGHIDSVRWDGRDQAGNVLSSGIYAYRLTLTDDRGFSRFVSQPMVINR
jgi:hypothetical protein